MSSAVLHSSCRRAAYTLCCAAALAVGAGTAAVADPARVELTDYWRVVEVTGVARMRAGENPWNGETAIAVGDVVGPYQSIATGSAGRAILVRGEDIIVIHANAVVALPPPAAGQAETEIVQSQGSAFYDVDPRDNPEFAVTTPYLIIGVKGTQFALTEGGAWLAVIEGVVDAQDRGSAARSDVTVGQGIAGTTGSGAFAPYRLSDASVASIIDMARLVDSRRTTWDSVVQGAEGAASGGSPADATNGVDAANGSVGGAVTGTASGLGDTVGGATSEIGGAVGETAGSLGGAAASAAEAAGGVVSGVGEAVGGALGGLGGL